MNSDFRVDTVSSGPLGTLQQISYKTLNSLPSTNANTNRSPQSGQNIKVVVVGDGGRSHLLIRHINEDEFSQKYVVDETSVLKTDVLPTSEPKPKTKKPKKKLSKKNKNPRLR